MLGSERLGLVGTKLLGFCPGVGLEVLSPTAVVLEEMLGFPELSKLAPRRGEHHRASQTGHLLLSLLL